MIRKIQTIILLAVIALGSTSCLEKHPENAIPTNKALQTVDDVNQAILGIYAGFKSSALYSGVMTICPDIQADMVYAVEGNTNTYGDFWRWEVLSDSRDVLSVYGALYTIIGRCNFVLENVDRVRANTTDDKALDEMIGETYFARALAYSELIRNFCKTYEPATAAETLGVVLVSSYSKPEPARRSSLEASYQFVLDDLKKAEELIVLECLPNGANADFFTTSVVNALYARVYLYMQNWDEAIAYSTKVIKDPALTLASTMERATTTKSWYKYMWTNDVAGEVIWRVNFSLSSYGGAIGRVFLNYDFTSFKPDFVPGEWALNLYDKKDLRGQTFFSTQTTGHSHRLTWPLLFKYLGNESFFNNRILHVCMPKPFRLSEQYLIRAEAYCNKKLFSQAASDITAVRSKRIENYGQTNVGEDNWLKTISDERVREFFMEGFRLHDLKRWHMGFDRTPQLNSIKEGSSLKIAADDPRFVWPIPQHELNSPGADIEPNESNN